MAKVGLGMTGAIVAIGLAGCADGASVVAERGDFENSVSIDEAVVEVETVDGSALESVAEDPREIESGDPNDVVDLDLASDSG